MDKLKQCFSLAIVFWGAANLSQGSLAQYWVPIQPPVPSHDIMFPGVRERSIDQNNEPDPTPRFRSRDTTSRDTTCWESASWAIERAEENLSKGATKMSIGTPHGRIKGSPQEVIAYFKKRC
jgi:hypothetical protein